jgi:hypothetical protein
MRCGTNKPMLGHYLVMAARSLVRHKLYGFINVAGSRKR